MHVSICIRSPGIGGGSVYIPPSSGAVWQGVCSRSALKPCVSRMPTGKSHGVIPVRCAIAWVPAFVFSQARDQRFRLPVRFFEGREPIGRRLRLRRPGSPCSWYRLDHLRNVGLDIPHLLQVGPASLVCSYSFTQASRFFLPGSSIGYISSR